MTKKYLSLLGIAIAVVALVFGGTFWWMHTHGTSPFAQQSIDELTGVWRAEGVSDDYNWYVQYTFKNGMYDMETDSSFKDNGTYMIAQRYEDNASLRITKTSIPFDKTYDIYITRAQDDSYISVDGMKLYRK